MSIEIPEGYIPAPWKIYEPESLHGRLSVRSHCGTELARIPSNNRATAELIALAPQMAAEIKRLEAENATMHRRFTDECDLKVAALRARILKLEAALGLPEGCDLFDIERAKVEGARTAEGEIWKNCDYPIRPSQTRFQFTNGVAQWWFEAATGLAPDDGDEQGKPFVRLYCIREGAK